MEIEHSKWIKIEQIDWDKLAPQHPEGMRIVVTKPKKIYYPLEK